MDIYEAVELSRSCNLDIHLEDHKAYWNNSQDALLWREGDLEIVPITHKTIDGWEVELPYIKNCVCGCEAEILYMGRNNIYRVVCKSRNCWIGPETDAEIPEKARCNAIQLWNKNMP